MATSEGWADLPVSTCLAGHTPWTPGWASPRWSPPGLSSHTSCSCEADRGPRVSAEEEETLSLSSVCTGSCTRPGSPPRTSQCSSRWSSRGSCLCPPTPRGEPPAPPLPPSGRPLLQGAPRRGAECHRCSGDRRLAGRPPLSSLKSEAQSVVELLNKFLVVGNKYTKLQSNINPQSARQPSWRLLHPHHGPNPCWIVLTSLKTLSPWGRSIRAIFLAVWSIGQSCPVLGKKYPICLDKNSFLILYKSSAGNLVNVLTVFILCEIRRTEGPSASHHSTRELQKLSKVICVAFLLNYL